MVFDSWIAIARRRCLGVASILLMGTAVAIGGPLSAQARRDTLIHVSTLVLPDSVPLTRIEQLVARADGSLYVLDVRSDGVLAFGPDGACRRRIGRQGEGPGELLAPWRMGLLGPDTLWVVDARRPRINLYDANTGASLDEIGSARWRTDAVAAPPPSTPRCLGGPQHSCVEMGGGRAEGRSAGPPRDR